MIIRCKGYLSATGVRKSSWVFQFVFNTTLVDESGVKRRQENVGHKRTPPIVNLCHVTVNILGHVLDLGLSSLETLNKAGNDRHIAPVAVAGYKTSCRTLLHNLTVQSYLTQYASTEKQPFRVHCNNRRFVNLMGRPQRGHTCGVGASPPLSVNTIII